MAIPIESGYDPKQEFIYDLFSDYFGNPVMTKLKNINNYSLYICKVADLGIEFRYIMVFIKQDRSILGHQEKLRSLPWINLQTRTLQEDHNLIKHSYIPTRNDNVNSTINLISKNDTSYIYKCDNIPIQVTLLGKKKNELDYNPTGRLINAIETYNTIINFV